MPHFPARPSPPFDPRNPIFIPWEGPTEEGTTLLVGERPGPSELEANRPLSGFSGIELDSYMSQVRLHRSLFRIGNLVPYYGPVGIYSTPRDIATGGRYLMSEIRKVKPSLIVTAGAASTHFFLGRDFPLDVLYGRPWRWKKSEEIFGPSHPCYIFPIFHPGGGAQDEEMIKFIYTSLKSLADMTETGMEGWNSLVPHDSHPSPKKKIFATADDWGDLSHHAILNGYLSQDTEYLHDGTTFCITISSRPDAGYLIPATDHEALSLITDLVQDERVLSVLHNSMADLSKLRQVGIHIPDEEGRMVDTMVMAYNATIEPQALKELAWRHFARRMKSYEDLTAPYSFSLAWEYLEKLKGYDWGKAGPVIERSCGKKKIVNPRSLNASIDAIFRDYEADKAKEGSEEKESKGIDIRERWKGVRPAVREMAEEMFGPMPLSDVSRIPIGELSDYSIDDAIMTGRLYPVLRHILASHVRPLSAPSLIDLNTLDTNVAHYADSMQSFGVKIDRPYFTKYQAELDDEAESISYKIYKLIGKEINPNSPKQVRELLFGDMGISPDSDFITDKGNNSTSDKAIEHLRLKLCEERSWELFNKSYVDVADEGERNKILDYTPLIFLGHTQDYRETTKFRDSFVEVLLNKSYEAEDERVRARWQLTRVSSGRFSCLDPNLMAQPVRGRGIVIREGFITDSDYEFGDADLNQAELRWAAHDSQDPHLLQVFREGKLDIHTDTAAMMNGIPYNMVDKKKHRDAAKRVGFGILTGITEYGLLAQFELAGIPGWTLDKCADAIAAWLDVNRGVSVWMQRCYAEANRYGGVADDWGRWRWLPGIWSRHKHIRGAAQRQSHSHKVQAGAQGYLKTCMKNIRSEVIPAYKAIDVDIRPILQVHDEVSFEITRGSGHEVIETVVNYLETAAGWLTVPMKAEGKVGANWKEAH